MLSKYLGIRLKETEKAGLKRNLLHRASPQGRVIEIQGQKLLNFGSNDYLDLASSPELKKASKEAIETYGAASGASRLLAGGTDLYQRVEKKLAEFKQTEEALLFNSGYTANLTVLQAIVDNQWTILSDELNHASIIDGCKLSRAKVFVYPHCDLQALEEKLKGTAGPKLIVTDSVFSMDGDIAPLPALWELAKTYEAVLYIDDAHATGVLGEGRGSLAHFKLKAEDDIIQMGTCSKALGSFGAFVAGTKVLIEFLISTARGLIFSTALPPASVGATEKAIEIIKEQPSRLKKLWENREALFEGLKSLGLDTGPTETPIIPVILKDNNTALSLSQFLFQRGFYCPAIRYPAVKTPRLRLTVTAAHEPQDIHALIDAFREAIHCGLL
ncbi:MAG: 8-amino-7-oxononanoate synthase [Nitrospirae bacterium]|nr:MAG: 8-amino-7-oxononanoate synthase [Nitrospirota bacterium]